MKQIEKILFVAKIILFSILFFACNRVSTISYSDWLKENFDEKKYIEILQQRFSKNETFDICYDQFQYFDKLMSFYSERNYVPVWTNDFVFNTKIDTILMFFGNSMSHGLDSNIFDAGIIRYYRNLLIQKTKYDSILDYKQLATLELLISNAVLTYTTSMQKGFVNISEVFPKSYFLPKKKN